MTFFENIGEHVDIQAKMDEGAPADGLTITCNCGHPACHGQVVIPSREVEHMALGIAAWAWWYILKKEEEQ